MKRLETTSQKECSSWPIGAAAVDDLQGLVQCHAVQSFSNGDNSNDDIRAVARRRIWACQRGGLFLNGGSPSRKQDYACDRLDSQLPTTKSLTLCQTGGSYWPMKVAGLRKLPYYCTPASAASISSTSAPMSLPSVAADTPGEALLQPGVLVWQSRGSLLTPSCRSRMPPAWGEETTIVPLGHPPLSPMMRFFSNL